MTAQVELPPTLFEQVFDNLRKITESQLQMQQEMFRQWGGELARFSATSDCMG